MTSEERVREGLAQLRSAMREQSASPRVEQDVLAAFRTARLRNRGSRAVWGWAAAACAAAAAVAVPWMVSLEGAIPAPPKAVVAQMPAATLQFARTEPAPVKRVRRVPPAARQSPELVAAANNARRPAGREIATEFLAIPAAPPMAINEDAQLVRVRVPAASMRNFGFAVSEERASERISADLLLGGDGVARAVRFVKTTY